MKNLVIIFIVLQCSAPGGFAQEKNDRWLGEYLRQHASASLLNILNKPDSFQYQLIYTKIDRDKNNRPQFRHYYLNVDANRYYNPASTVKMPLAFLALEKLNELNVAGLDRTSAMFIDSSFERQTRVNIDSTSENKLPSIGHYIKKIFLVSDNDAYSRLYEFLGQQYINERLSQKGYPRTRITRRFVTMNEEQNRHTNRIRFFKEQNLVFEQAPVRSNFQFDFSKRLLVGNAHLNRDDSLIQSPMDFTNHNNFPLEDLQQILQSVIFPESVPLKQRFNLKPEDFEFLYRYMSEYPSESKFPNYDTVKYYDSYCKFFFFRAGKNKIPDHIRSFNKPGWSYGFLTDAAYIVDFKNKVEFMLSGMIYVNSDGVLNDDKYEYETIGWPYFREVGEILYGYELERKRKHKPNLDKFIINYKQDH